MAGQRENAAGHAENREYSPTQGNWLRPDPAGLAAVDADNPQSWNRYAYVLNDLTGLVDPSGLESIPLTPPPPGVPGPPSLICINPLGCSDIPEMPWERIPRQTVAQFDDMHSRSHRKPPAANNGFTWAWNFAKSLFGRFNVDTGPGSCIGVAIDSAQPILRAANKLQDYSKKYVAPIVATVAGNGATLSSGMYAMADYAAQMKAAPSDVSLFTAAAGGISIAATDFAAWGAQAIAAVPKQPGLRLMGRSSMASYRRGGQH